MGKFKEDVIRRNGQVETPDGLQRGKTCAYGRDEASLIAALLRFELRVFLRRGLADEDCASESRD